MMHTQQESTRRHFFSRCGMGLGSIALGSLMAGQPKNNPFAPKRPHQEPRAKNVIYLFMGGGHRNWSCLIGSQNWLSATDRIFQIHSSKANDLLL